MSDGTAKPHRQHDLWILRPEEHQKNSKMPKEARGRYALAALADWVQSVFPQPKKLPKPPT